MSNLQSRTVKPAGLDQSVIDQAVVGSRRFSNVVLALAVTAGGLGFVLASFSSKIGQDIVPFLHTSQLGWFPQGAAMGFYGFIAIILAIYLWIIILIDLGGGYNLFDKKTGTVTISRRGFRKHITVEVPFSDIQAVKIEVRDGLSAVRRILLRVRGRRDLPLSRVGEPIPLADLEISAATLARFLSVPLDGI